MHVGVREWERNISRIKKKKKIDLGMHGKLLDDFND